jgi:hypothetical protein
MNLLSMTDRMMALALRKLEIAPRIIADANSARIEIGGDLP